MTHTLKIKDLYTHFLSELDKIYPETEIKSFIYLVFDHIFGYNRLEVHENFKMEVPDEQYTKIKNIVYELKQYRPLQYILGEKEFKNCKIKVNESVLIPRPETEELVDWILNTNTCSEPNILDIGTGSGCIAIVLQKNLRGSLVSGSDISEKALELAKINASLNKVNVKFYLDNIFQPSRFFQANSFDLIVSNPPYVRDSEKKMMDLNVLNWEPPQALFVPDKDPLMFYNKIFPYSYTLLKNGGMLFVEINEKFSEDIKSMLSSYRFTNLEVKKDISGKYRMARGQKS